MSEKSGNPPSYDSQYPQQHGQRPTSNIQYPTPGQQQPHAAQQPYVVPGQQPYAEQQPHVATGQPPYAAQQPYVAPQQPYVVPGQQPYAQQYPPYQQNTVVVSSGFRYNAIYLRTGSAFFKILEIAFAIASLACVQTSYFYYTDYLFFACIYSLVMSFIGLCLHLSSQMIFVRRLRAEIGNCCLTCILNLVAGILMLVCTIDGFTYEGSKWRFITSSPWYRRYIVAGVFALLNAVAYAAEVFFNVKLLNDAQR